MKMWKADDFICQMRYRAPPMTNTITTVQTNLPSTSTAPINPTDQTDQTMQITHNNINYHLHASILIQLLSSGDGGGEDPGSSITVHVPFQEEDEEENADIVNSIAAQAPALDDSRNEEDEEDKKEEEDKKMKKIKKMKKKKKLKLCLFKQMKIM